MCRSTWLMHIEICAHFGAHTISMKKQILEINLFLTFGIISFVPCDRFDYNLWQVVQLLYLELES